MRQSTDTGKLACQLATRTAVTLPPNLYPAANAAPTRPRRFSTQLTNAPPVVKIETAAVVKSDPPTIKKAANNAPFTHQKTGLEFVRVAAGDFLYGDKKETKTLPEFWIKKTPITHTVYQRFIDANPVRAASRSFRTPVSLNYGIGFQVVAMRRSPSQW